MEFKEMVGEEYLNKRRQRQMQKGMWKYLGEALRLRLQEDEDNKYYGLVKQTEHALLDERMSGNQAA